MASKVNNVHKSIKHEVIDKTNTRVIISVAVATFIFVFCAFAARALISQSLYHDRVIEQKKMALKQLEQNIDIVGDLRKSYDTFQGMATNILGGSSAGTGSLDGKNAKLVLDALPDAYDYPALSSSFEKILRDGGYDIGSIGGIEDPTLNSSGQSPTKDVKPIEIPYTFSVTSNTEGTKRLLETLEASIRPMYVDTLQIQSSGNTLQTRVALRTFFTQPKVFQLGSREVK